MSDKIKIQLGAIVILIILAVSLLLSQTATPDFPPLFALKRYQENLFLKLKSNPSEKADYMRALLDTRLSELSSQVKGQSYGFILPSASRYSTLAGQITDLVINNNLTSEKQALIAQFNDHLKTLEQIYVIYPKNTENVEYKYIEDDINYLKLYLQKLEK